MSKKVAVPKELLERLEEDRVRLYDMCRENGCAHALSENNMTATMWKLANTRWGGVDNAES